MLNVSCNVLQSYICFVLRYNVILVLALNKTE